MTSTIESTPAAPAAPARPASRPGRPDGAHPVRFWAPVGIGLLAGTPLVVYSFAYAATHRTTQIQFDLFWLGVLAFAGPVAHRALSRRTTPTQRWLLVGLLGAWDYLPKFLRDPGGPIFSDELAHYRQVLEVSSTHHLYPANPLLPIVAVFPGQQALVASLHQVTGLSVWTVAEITLLLLHTATVVGVMALAARLTGSYRAAAVSAVVFATTSNLMFFDAQFSYESIGLPLAVWTLVAAAHAVGRGEPTARRRAWVALGVLTGLACVVTHHLSSYILGASLTSIAVAHSWVARRNSGPVSSRAARQAAWTLAVVTVAGAALWLVPAGQVIGYYSPYLSSGAHQVLHLLDRSGGSRTLFKASSTPLYEQLAAFAGPPIVLALGVTAFRHHRRRLYLLGPAYVALVVTGVVGYFASLPFTLTAFGSEGAHRSWTFSYIGVALLAGPVVEHHLLAPAGRRLHLGAGHRSTGHRSTGHRSTGHRGAVIAAMLIVLLVGNTASSVDVAYRFPGPYVYGSDTRSLTEELMYLTRWFQQTQPPHPGVIADRYTGLALGGFAGAELAAPSKGFPVWQMYFDPGGPPVGLLAAVGYSDYDYLVVDSRMARFVPLLGVYFGYSEPGALTRTEPVPAAALERYHLQPWATEVLDSTHYSVYRLNAGLLQQLGGSG